MNGIRRTLALSVIALLAAAGMTAPASAAAPATVTISGTVTDGSGHGYPLLVGVAFCDLAPGSGCSEPASDPFTGHYSITVPANSTVNIAWITDGYDHDVQGLVAGTQDVTLNAALTVLPSCSAPGYTTNAGGQCVPVPGGLVAGTVTDANTGQGVSGATVTAGSAGTPVSSGYTGVYDAFAPDTPGGGPTDITAAKAKYVTTTAQATVADNQVVKADMALPAGRLAFTAGQVTTTSGLGGTKQATVTLTNTGGGPATATLSSNYGAAPAALPAAKASLTPAAAASPAAATRLPATTSRAGAIVTGPDRMATRRPAPAGPVNVRSALRSLLARQSAASAGAIHGNAAADAGGWTTLPSGPYTTDAVGNVGDGFADFGMARDDTTGRIYAVGGIESVNNSEATIVTNAVRMYDTDTQVWSAIAPLPGPLEAPAAAFIHGKLYVAGGWAFNTAGVLDGVSSVLYIYDPATNSWSTGARLLAGRAEAGATVLNGQLYMVGGCDDSSCSSTQDVQVYDPVADAWQTVAPYPVPVSYGACGGIDGKLYCAGGVTSTSSNGAVTADTAAAYSWTPATNTWQQVTSMPQDLWGMSYATANGKLIVSSGITGGVNGQATAQTLAYDPAAGTWSQLPDYPSKVTGGTIYLGAMTCGLFQLGGSQQSNLGDFPENTFYQLPGYDQCGPPDSPGWLTVSSPAQVSVPAHSSVTVTITVGAGLEQPGTDTGHIDAYAADTPYDSVSLTVNEQITPPKGWGAITGTVSAPQPCDAPATPLHEATVQIQGPQGSVTLHTDAAGHYEWWLPVSAAGNSATVLISKDGYDAQYTQVHLTPGQPHPADTTLSTYRCG